MKGSLTLLDESARNTTCQIALSLYETTKTQLQLYVVVVKATVFAKMSVFVWDCNFSRAKASPSAL